MSWYIAAAQAATGIGGMLDNRWNRKNQKENVDRTIEANKAEAELKYQRDVDFWHMQNKYNSPEAQMERFKAAGLNPHLIYGSGTPGNASSPVNYSPPNIQYAYAPNRAGAVMQQLLPTAMAVGTWLQEMRKSEVEIQSKQTNMSRTQQLVDYLEQANPVMLRKMEEQANILGYQRDASVYLGQKAQMQLADLNAAYRVKYGDNMFKGAHNFGSDWRTPIGGLSRQKFIKDEAEARLKQAQASWTDYDITNPQALVQLVLSGIMQQAGMSLRRPSTGRINQNRRSTHEVENVMRGGRRVIRRRTYEY